MHKIQLQLEKKVKKDDLIYQLKNIRDMCEYAIVPLATQQMSK